MHFHASHGFGVSFQSEFRFMLSHAARSGAGVLLTVTPAGAAVSEVAAAVEAFEKYLTGGAPPKAAMLETGSAAADAALAYYYEDASGMSQVDGAGWWSGSGAAGYGLGGVVDPQAMRSMMIGRHPMSGERLLSARGSAGREGLKAGKPTRLIEGRPVWSVSDVAAVLATNHASAAASVEGLDDALIVAEGGETFVADEGLTVLMVDLGLIEPLKTMNFIEQGDSTERLMLKDIAEATGISRRYWATLCQRAVAGDEHLGFLDPTRQVDRKRWTLSRGAVQRFLEERDPPHVRFGYDVTLTVEKSVSMLQLDPRLGSVAADAVRAANDAAMSFLDEHASNARAKQASIGTLGLTSASFMHGTSREEDPNLHVHNLVMNTTKCADGQGRALDASGLFVNAPAAAALATAEMRRELTQRLGVEWAETSRGVWEIEGIDASTRRAFSKRRQAILAVLEEITGVDDSAGAKASEREAASLATRSAKSALRADDLIDQWRRQADEIGFDPMSLVGARDRNVFEGSLTQAQRASLWRWLESPGGVCSSASVFHHGDLFWAIADWKHDGDHLGLLSAEQIKAEAQVWLQSQRALKVQARRSAEKDGRSVGAVQRDLWTTQTMVQLQSRIAARWEKGLGGGGARVGGHRLKSVVAKVEGDLGFELTDEQYELVAAWTSSGDRIGAAIGRPGTGKTTTMRAAAAAWESAGYQVVGASVKGEAARLLGEEAGIESHTLASYLVADQHGDNPLTERHVLVVDEASTLSDWDLNRVIDMCEEAGATLRLIGDPRQHGSVEAGGTWNWMVDVFKAHTPELRHQRRVKNPLEAEAAEQLRQGAFRDAMDSLKAAGSVDVHDSWEDALGPLMRRWWDLRRENKHHPIVERTNARRQILNTLAQGMRRSAGEIGPLFDIGGGAVFGVGDEVMARAPNKFLRNAEMDDHVRNGSLGVIVAIGLDDIRVDFDALGVVAVPHAWASGDLDLAYSVTSYSVQGATFEVSTSVATSGMGQAEALVDITRGKEQNKLIVVGADRGEYETHDGERDVLPEVVDSIRETDRSTVAQRDPALVEAALRGYLGLPIDKLYELASTTDAPAAIQAAIGQSEHKLVAAEIANPSPATLELFGPRPKIPYAQQEWERQVSAKLLARFRPGPELEVVSL